LYAKNTYSILVKQLKFCIYRRTFSIFGNQYRTHMIKVYYFLAVTNPLLFLSEISSGVDKETLVLIIIALSILLFVILGYELIRFLRNRNSGFFSIFFRKIQLKVSVEKDRLFYPKVLTLTIRNTGNQVVDISSPVLEYRKIWSKRKFKLNGVSGQQIYPLLLDPGKIHQLPIETATFLQYDHDLKSYYWARIYVSDVEGRKWKSNEVKLRKSLVT